MRRDDDIFSGLHLRPDHLVVVGQRPRRRVLEALTAWRRDVIAAAPDVHLLLAPAAPRIVLIEAGQVAIIALVQRLVLVCFEAALAHPVEDARDRKSTRLNSSH